MKTLNLGLGIGWGILAFKSYSEAPTILDGLIFWGLVVVSALFLNIYFKDLLK